MDPLAIANIFASRQTGLKEYSIFNILEEYLNDLNEIDGILNNIYNYNNNYYLTFLILIIVDLFHTNKQ